MKRPLCLTVLILYLATSHLTGQTQDDQYVKIYLIVEQADQLSSQGKRADALIRYKEAETALRKLKTIYPDYNPKMVDYRLNYLNGKISTLEAMKPIPAAVPKKETTGDAK